MPKQQMVDVPECELPADDDLVRAALSDPSQFAILYRRYVSRVYRYFYGRIGITLVWLRCSLDQS